MGEMREWGNISTWEGGICRVRLWRENGEGNGKKNAVNGELKGKMSLSCKSPSLQLMTLAISAPWKAGEPGEVALKRARGGGRDKEGKKSQKAGGRARMRKRFLLLLLSPHC